MKLWPWYKNIYSCAGSVYLVRYNLIKCRWFNIYLHHILRSDEDRELHDHPFSFWSIILWGGYWEERVGGVLTRYEPGSCLWRPAPSPHRLAVSRPAWTLVIRGPKKREWGFYTKQGWVEWYKFLRAKGCD